MSEKNLHFVAMPKHEKYDITITISKHIKGTNMLNMGTREAYTCVLHCYLA